MFVWTRNTVLAALDAGIAEVVSAYNSSYQFAVMHGISVPKAYGYAFDAVADWLNREEELRIAHLTIDSVFMLLASEAWGDGAEFHRETCDNNDGCVADCKRNLQRVHYYEDLLSRSPYQRIAA